MIKEAIKLGKAADAGNALEKEVDVARVVKVLEGLAKNEAGCLWEINRSDRAYRMQYELFRQDKLPQSKSMLATILDRILRPKDELKKVQQEVKGDKLPRLPISSNSSCQAVPESSPTPMAGHTKGLSWRSKAAAERKT